MKNNNRFYKCLAGFAAALTIITLACLPGSAQAQGKQGQQLMKVQTYEDLQNVEVGDTIIMSCPKCKTTYAQVVEKGFKTGSPDELKNVTIHLCSSCDTTLVTKGTGKQAENVLVHTCKTCGSTDVSCCVLKKGNPPTSGM